MVFLIYTHGTSLPLVMDVEDMVDSVDLVLNGSLKGHIEGRIVTCSRCVDGEPEACVPFRDVSHIATSDIR